MVESLVGAAVILNVFSSLNNIIAVADLNTF